MYLISGTDTFFKRGNTQVPLLDEANSKNLTALNDVIDETCPLLLLNTLGSVAFADFDQYVVNGVLIPIPADPTPDPVPAKWRKLVNGATYTNPNGVENKWKGLVFTDGTHKGSLLAQWSFYWFLGDNGDSYLSGVGQVRADAKNAQSVSVAPYSVKAWNRFLAMYQGNYNPCSCQWSDVLYWNWQPYFYGSTYSVSLLQFLAENPADYGVISPVLYELQNVWAI